MRWKKRRQPMFNDERIINKFLFFPKEINNDVRWLERVMYKEIFLKSYPSGIYSWVKDCWIDK